MNKGWQNWRGAKEWWVNGCKLRRSLDLSLSLSLSLSRSLSLSLSLSLSGGPPKGAWKLCAVAQWRITLQKQHFHNCSITTPSLPRIVEIYLKIECMILPCPICVMAMCPSISSRRESLDATSLTLASK